jgi:hypothetical protein
MAHLNIETEDDLIITTESGLALVTEDLIQPPPKLTGKKILSFPEVNNIQGTIRIRGNTRLPQGNQVITLRGSAFESIHTPCNYTGIVDLELNGIIEGTQSLGVAIEASVVGQKSKVIQEELIINGKKDYTKMIQAIEEIINE